jgi:hypothetical protein
MIDAARVAKPTGTAGIAAPWATVWAASASEPQCGSIRCLKFVLLGVGYWSHMIFAVTAAGALPAAFY